MTKENKTQLQKEMSDILKQSISQFFKQNHSLSYYNPSGGMQVIVSLNSYQQTKNVENFIAKSELYIPFQYYNSKSHIIYHRNTYYFDFKSEVALQFLTLWYKSLNGNAQYEQEFLSVCRRVAGFHDCVEFLKQKPKTLKAFFSLPGKNRIPDNNDFYKGLKIAQEVFSENDFFECLQEFCKNNKVFIKRIEVINILNEFVSRFTEEHQLAFKDITTLSNSDDLILRNNEVWGIYFDKKNLFSAVYNNNIKDKNVLTEYLEMLVYWLNDDKCKNVLERLGLEQVFLQNKSTKLPFLLVLTGKNPKALPYEEIFTFFIKEGIQPWLNKSTSLDNTLSILLTQFLLSKKMETQTEANNQKRSHLKKI